MPPAQFINAAIGYVPLVETFTHHPGQIGIDAAIVIARHSTAFVMVSPHGYRVAARFVTGFVAVGEGPTIEEAVAIAAANTSSRAKVPFFEMPEVRPDRTSADVSRTF
jgi:hypothetical protein